MNRLLDVMRRLRSDNGCPWDREQTFNSLREYVIEEAYELVDAISHGDTEDHVEELGDLLLQIAFQAVIAEETNLFSYQDIENGICDKLIERHPHVFSDETAEHSDDVLKIWNRNKKKKKGSVTDGIPSALPALMKASKIHRRLKSLKDTDDAGESYVPDIADKEELGNLLYNIVTKSVDKGLEPEQALNDHITKIILGDRDGTEKS
ncbi:MAG: MazG family protein [Candidatus Muiribacteriaceae bacterium]